MRSRAACILLLLLLFIVIIIIIIKNECHSNIRLQSIDFKVAATAKSCGKVKVKVSDAAVKSFDRRCVSCNL